MSTRARSKSFDQIREQLERMARESFEGEGPSPEEARRILDERARSIARVTHDATNDVPRMDVIVFSSHGERYAIETSYVRETVRSLGTTRVPGTPEWIVGIESVRGEIVAVVDLAALFDAPKPPAPATSSPALSAGAATSLLLVIGRDQAELALRCDDVAEVATLRRDRIVAPPRAATSGGKRDVLGVTDDAIIVLDAAALLGDPRLFVEQTEEIEV